MYAKTLVLLSSVAGIVLAEPIPQAAATTSFDPSSVPTDVPDDFDTSSFESAIDSAIASLTEGVPSYYSDLPTLPPSIVSVLATASPSGEVDDPCATTEPAWVKNLPNSVQDALSSYETALSSWYSEHSSDINAGITGAIATDDICNTGGGSGSAPTDTAADGSSGSAPTDTAAAGGAAATTASGGQTTAAPGGSTNSAGGSTNTAKGTVASTTVKPGSAARPTGAVAAGFAGVIGMIGLMVAL